MYIVSIYMLMWKMMRYDALLIVYYTIWTYKNLTTPDTLSKQTKITYNLIYMIFIYPTISPNLFKIFQDIIEIVT